MSYTAISITNQSQQLQQQYSQLQQQQQQSQSHSKQSSPNTITNSTHNHHLHPQLLQQKTSSLQNQQQHQNPNQQLQQPHLNHNYQVKQSELIKPIKKKVNNRKLRLFGEEDDYEQKKYDEQRENQLKYKREFYIIRLCKSSIASFFDFTEFMIHLMKFIYDYIFCCRLICFLLRTDPLTQRRKLQERKYHALHQSNHAINSTTQSQSTSSFFNHHQTSHSSSYSTSLTSSQPSSINHNNNNNSSTNWSISSLSQGLLVECQNENDIMIQSCQQEQHQQQMQLNNFQSSMRMYDDHKNNLVLDLDETLIHCDERSLRDDSQIINVQFDEHVKTFYLHQREYLQEFLESCAQNYNIYIYTASVKQYADEVVKQIDPRLIIKKIYSRSSCYFDGKIYNKSLKTLGLDLNRTVMIDNSQAIVSNNNANAFKIKDYIDDKNDRELLKFSHILNKMANTQGHFKNFIQNYQS